MNEINCITPHPKLLIVDYYGSLVNTIDIQTESFLIGVHTEDEISLVNKTREFFIDRIKQVEKDNLDVFEVVKSADERELVYGDLKKEALFKNFCFLIFNERYIRGILLKVKLVITDWYISEKKIKLIK